MTPICLFSFLFISQFLPLVSTAKCPSSFNCGKLGNFQFPFTTTKRPDCGVLAISGCDYLDSAADKSIKVQIEGQSFYVISFDYNTIVIRDNNLHNYLKSESCGAFRKNVTLPRSSPFASFEIKNNITLFRCNHSLNISPSKPFLNYPNCSDYDIFYYCPNNVSCPSVKYPKSFAACSTIQLPTRERTDTNHPFTFLASEIHIRAQLSPDCSKCIKQEKGHCQLDNVGIFYCSKEKTGSKMLIVATVAGGVVVVMVLAWCFRKRYPLLHIFSYRGRRNPTNQVIETFLREHGHLPTRRYSYSEVKIATNSFINKLGQGGYGSVYKGQLQDGHHVAVKVLSELKGDGAEFINEVASISRTSHVNVVRLLGFCFEGSKRALIYEFMPNGSLEKFIYEENIKMADYQLDCETLYKIAIGVARGLEYLHRGCNTRILHMDIKPHNILLDNDFSPKISDFGLAKLCLRQESIVSIYGARGTAGYIAPEVFSRNFGEVSHKSDVYSYGMMILEMVGGRKNINIKVECSSAIYFPHWIYKRVELNQELELWCIRNEVDKERVRKMIIIGLWCIQTNPNNRPGMSKVMEMLEGSIDSLEVPPKPFLTSPSRSLSHHSIQTC